MFSKSLLKIVGLLFYFQNKNDNIQLLFNVTDILYIYIGHNRPSVTAYYRK